MCPCVYTIVCTRSPPVHDASASRTTGPNAATDVSNSTRPSPVRNATTCENASTMARSSERTDSSPVARLTGCDVSPSSMICDESASRSGNGDRRRERGTHEVDEVVAVELVDRCLRHAGGLERAVEALQRVAAALDVRVVGREQRHV